MFVVQADVLHGTSGAGSQRARCWRWCHTSNIARLLLTPHAHKPLVLPPPAALLPWCRPGECLRILVMLLIVSCTRLMAPCLPLRPLSELAAARSQLACDREHTPAPAAPIVPGRHPQQQNSTCGRARVGSGSSSNICGGHGEARGRSLALCR